MDDPRSPDRQRGRNNELPSERPSDRLGTEPPDAPTLIKPHLAALVALRPAEQHDLIFIDHLQRQFGESVGFMPRIALDQYLQKKAVVLAWENGQPAGYVISRVATPYLPSMSPIYQLCICMDAHRRHIGTALLEVVIHAARLVHNVGVQANCAVGVQANEFWSASVFVPICHFVGGTARGREIICWRRPLAKKIPLWFALPPARVGFPPRAPQIVRNPNRQEVAIEIAKRYITRRTPLASTPREI